MADNLQQDMDGLNASFREMDKLLKSITHEVKKFSQGMASTARTGGVAGGGFGQLGLGNSGGNIMGNSFGNIPQMLGRNRMMNFGANALMGGIQAITSLAGGAFAAMPDVAATTARSSGFYNANLMMGLGSNGRNRLAQATFGAMKGGLSAPGMDAVTAGVLGGMGVQYGQSGVNSGQFSMLAKSTANAAKYLNIDNATAAQALGGLTSGGTSQSLMRNFGIYTTDPTTGRRLSPTEIFKSLNARMTGGKKLSRQELMTSYQGGTLGTNLQNSGLDPTQQRLALQYMLDASEGKNMDLGNDKLMARLQKDAGVNPDQAMYSANTASTATMQAASDAYIEGMKKAVPVIENFNKAMQGFLKSPAGQMMAQLNGGMSLAMGDNVVGGMAGGIGGALGGLGMIGGSLLQTAMLSKTMKSLGAGGAQATGAGASGTIKGNGRNGGPKGSYWNEKAGRWMKGNKFVAGSPPKGAGPKPKGWSRPSAGGAAGGFKNALKGGLKAGGVMSLLGLAMDAGENMEATEQGYGGSAWGESIGSAVGSTALGALGFAIPVPGLNVVAGIGLGMLGGWLGGMAGKAIGSNFDSAGKGDSGGTIATGRNSDSGGPLKLIHPVGKAKVTSKYGNKEGFRKHMHRGIDFGVAVGTPVQAAAAGKVVYAAGSAANTWNSGGNSGGMQVHIDHGQGYKTLYMHLSAIRVSVGDQVTQGQVIGLSGNSGYSSGPHLHFQLEKNGVAIDPSAALGGNYAALGGDLSGSSQNSSGPASSVAGSAGELGYSVPPKADSAKVPSSYSGASIGKSAVALAGGGQGQNGHASADSGAGKGGPEGGAPGGIDHLAIGGTKKSKGANVVINVQVPSVSESEARKFATMVKRFIEEDKLMTSMGER